MKRRTFLQTGLGLSAAVAMGRFPGLAYPAAGVSGEGSGETTYRVGEKISAEAFVIDAELNRVLLADLVQERADASVIVLYIFGGGSIHRQKLGGIWCQDSFEDLQIPRYLHLKYQDEAVKLLPIAVAPVYATKSYGLEDRVFLDQQDDSDIFKKSAREFIDSTEQVFYDGFIPEQPYFDLRNRLLFNRRKDLAPGKGYGEVFPWQGKFRAKNEDQKYGVPTVWLLNGDGEILDAPFHGNHYHGDAFEIHYTVVDVDRAIEKHL